MARAAVFLHTPWPEELPVRSAEWLVNKVEPDRGWAFGYIGSVFLITLQLVFASEALPGEPQPDIVDAREDNGTVVEAQEEFEEVELQIE